MVTFNLAYTAPINPVDASPQLTDSQCWTGLNRKVRRAQEFVPIITDCKVLSEENLETALKIVREVKFSDAGPGENGEPIREVCLLYAPCRVDFEQENGSRISNFISHGQAGELLMTYVFEWRHPETEEGSVKAKTLEEHHWKVSRRGPHPIANHRTNPMEQRQQRWRSKGALAPFVVWSRPGRFSDGSSRYCQC